MTDTELKVIAALAITALSKRPKDGYVLAIRYSARSASIGWIRVIRRAGR
jgi:hypothetical protein